jgi:hypothetical protein
MCSISANSFARFVINGRPARGLLHLPALAGGGAGRLGLYPIVTFEKQLLNMIGKLV